MMYVFVLSMNLCPGALNYLFEIEITVRKREPPGALNPQTKPRVAYLPTYLPLQKEVAYTR